MVDKRLVPMPPSRIVADPRDFERRLPKIIGFGIALAISAALWGVVYGGYLMMMAVVAQ